MANFVIVKTTTNVDVTCNSNSINKILDVMESSNIPSSHCDISLLVNYFCY